ncbi:hypothetical protein [Brucella sp. JSBI001]|uniref:hypothetical protein n=1 Tax=Brucella sp. JSBI001 TaxID=2886044 RepID=UPI002230B6C3|nr:hypothetical protein [Brucella sp. JSBI001]UZD70793.1 hypothetical protein LJ361_05060 [Brucella sp. JSBI001]
MDIQKRIKEWIIGELKARGHGSKSKLAAHLGVRPDAITRMLNLAPNKEVRIIHAEELVKISEFLVRHLLALPTQCHSTTTSFFRLTMRLMMRQRRI